MSRSKEHAKPPAAIQVVEMGRVSKENWSDAARQLVEGVSETYLHITGLDVLHSTAVVR